MMIEMVVSGDIGDDVQKAILESARTGEIGDGRVWWRPVYNNKLIRTGERPEYRTSQIP